MRASEIIIGLLVFSALSTGMLLFYQGVADTYSAELEEGGHDLVEMSEKFNVTATINNDLKSIQEHIESFDPLNLASYGNLIGIVVRVFKVFLEIPLVVHEMITGVTASLFLPGWFASLIEIILLAMLVFAGISVMQQYKV